MNVVFGSLSQMLSPAGLSGVVGAALGDIQRTALNASHFSGNILEKVTGQCDGRSVSFVLKRFLPEKDWVMRLTADVYVREVTLYTAGVYSSLPSSLWHPILAVARDEGSWATLMDDVTPWLLTSDTATDGVRTQLIRHLAAMHARFFRSAEIENTGLGLASLQAFVGILSPQTIRSEIVHGHTDRVLTAAADGWAVFERLGTPEIVDLVRQVQANPERVLTALGRMPPTLVHGDYKLANLGVMPAAPEPRTIVLDWQDATRGPGLLDLAYWMAVNPKCFPGNAKDAALVEYRRALEDRGAFFSDRDWAHDVSICLLSGGGLRLFWQQALRAQRGDPGGIEEFRWWEAQTLLAKPWLN